MEEIPQSVPQVLNELRERLEKIDNKYDCEFDNINTREATNERTDLKLVEFLKLQKDKIELITNDNVSLYTSINTIKNSKYKNILQKIIVEEGKRSVFMDYPKSFVKNIIEIMRHDFSSKRKVSVVLKSTEKQIFVEFLKTFFIEMNFAGLDKRIIYKT